MAIILGIETSCDETGVALYDTERGLLANTLFSQILLHQEYGGVVPELASRDHIEKILPLTKECCKLAGITLTDIDAVAYTVGPGLNGALLVGAGFATGLAFRLECPTIPVHHLEGHLLSPFLASRKPEMPFVALLVSGGHSQIISVTGVGEYQILGDTLDDAAGEAFDKTAKMLGLAYPGGVHIANLARYGQDRFNLPRPMYDRSDLNMSFSGLKTAVMMLINNMGGVTKLTGEDKQDIAKSIEEAITDVLVKKSELAIRKTGIKRLVVSGGVSANRALRDKLDKLLGINVYYPPLEFCTDNGAMIALVGGIRYSMRKFDYSFNVHPRYNLAELDPL